LVTVNRREFLKLSGVLGASLALSEFGFNTPKIEASTKEFKLANSKEFTSICTFCSCGCGMICHVKDDKLINLEGDPDHIINEGSLCSKGASMQVVPNSDQRVKTPLYRAPGASEWTEISWDEAIDRVAKKYKEVRDKHWIENEVINGETFNVKRTDAIGIIGGAQNNNEECYLMTKFARATGVVYYEHQARL